MCQLAGERALLFEPTFELLLLRFYPLGLPLQLTSLPFDQLPLLFSLDDIAVDRAIDQQRQQKCETAADDYRVVRESLVASLRFRARAKQVALLRLHRTG